MCNLGEGLIEKYMTLGLERGEQRGIEKQRIQTERERKRADEAEAEIARLLEENARLKAKEASDLKK